MLFISDKDNKTIATWHVGNFIYLQSATNIDRVQADGDELEHIKNTFSNIPYHKNNPVQVWTGDLARFIALNLKA